MGLNNMRIYVCLVNLLIVLARPRNGQWDQRSSDDVSDELNCDTYISKSFDQGKLWEVVVGLLANIERNQNQAQNRPAINMGPTFIYNTGYYNWGNINGGIGSYQPGLNQNPYRQPYQQVNGRYGSITQGYQNGPNRPRGNPQGQFQGHPRGRQQGQQSNTNQSLLNQLLSAFTKTNNGGITKIMNKSTGQRATCNDIKINFALQLIGILLVISTYFVASLVHFNPP